MNMLFPELISWAHDNNASDIHIISGQALWLRINGELQFFEEYYFNPSELLEYASLKKQRELKKNNSIDISIQSKNGIRARASLFHQLNGLSAVVRLIPNTIPSLSELPAPTIFNEWIKKTAGLILITGPTGCGKTTTLASLISAINQQSSKHIVALEDPIEFIYANDKSVITQKECKTHFDDFSNELKNILREDPDIILVGEMRDPETIKLALNAAETGHLVLATLHTANVINTVNRIIDAFPPAQHEMIRARLAECLLGVASQRLVNKNGKREAEFEVLVTTAAVKQYIRENQNSHLIMAMQTGARYGMQLFSGETTFYN